VRARDHAAEGIALYQVERHRSQAFVYGGHDPGVCCRIHGGWALWLLGYPDQGLKVVRQALTLARELAHPHSLVWALISNAVHHQLRREPLERGERDAAFGLGNCCVELPLFNQDPAQNHVSAGI
jgi:predicted ATPase